MQEHVMQNYTPFNTAMHIICSTIPSLQRPNAPHVPHSTHAPCAPRALEDTPPSVDARERRMLIISALNPSVRRNVGAGRVLPLLCGEEEHGHIHSETSIRHTETPRSSPHACAGALSDWEFPRLARPLESPIHSQRAESFYRIATVRRREGAVSFPAWEGPAELVMDIRENCVRQQEDIGDRASAG